MKSELNHIKNYSAEDFRRYWNNQMSAEEMHALEKAAVDDPFLADALEGYSKLQQDPSEDIALLRKRLAARSVGAEVVPMKKNYWWKVAAVLILLAGLGTVTLWMMENKSSSIAKNNAAASDSFKPAANAAPAESQSKTDSLALSGNYSSGIAQQSEENSYKAPVPRLKDLSPAKTEGKEFANTDTTTANYIAGRAAGVDANRQLAPVSSAIDSNIKKNQDDDADRLEKIASRKSEPAPEARGRIELYNSFSGKVVDAQYRSIPYATVRMNNANQIAAADQNGVFQFKSRDTIAEISISSVGYEERYLTLNRNQSGVNIILDRADNDKGKLKDVGIKSVGKKANDRYGNVSVYVTEDAEPVIGWDKYNRYIDSNKRIPPGESIVGGEVVLSFKVDKKGELSSFEVEKSLNKTYDKEAIRLIKEGPKWRVIKGKKARVKLIVKF